MKKGINKQSDEVTDLQIGPTNRGMVRIYVTSNNIDLPMDFSPEEAIKFGLIDKIVESRKS